MTATPTPGIWRRLLESATAAVERPADGVLARDFKHCAVIAHSRGVLPMGEDREAAKPINALIGFGRAWPALGVGDRRANAEPVLAAALALEAQLAGETPATPAPPAWTNRADIGG